VSAVTVGVGPWSDGLNLTRNRDLSVFLKPSELGQALNVVYTIDGFIEPRPGCKVLLEGTSDIYTGYPDFYNLGSIILPTGENIVLVNAYSSGVSKVYKIYSPTDIRYYFSATGAKFTHVKSYETNDVNYKGVFFFAEQSGQSYRTDDFNLVTVPTLITVTTNYPTAIPGSHGGLIVKNRLFLWNYVTSEFMWSAPNKVLYFDFAVQTDPTLDYGGLEPIDKTTEADGITCVEFNNNNFYIFKRYKMYMFTYQDNPNIDAYLRKSSDNMGAYASTMFRNNIVVINNRGVFKVDNNDFDDLQSKINLRFEIPLDHTSISTDNIFITDFNNDIMFGYRDVSDVVNPKSYYYCMNGENGAWSEWKFDYAPSIAA